MQCFIISKQPYCKCFQRYFYFKMLCLTSFSNNSIIFIINHNNQNNFINQMNTGSGLSVQQIYTLVNHTDLKGVEGYHVEKKYFDAAKQMKDKQLQNIKKGQKDRKHVTKRGNYLQDEQKAHKAVPGPGQYPLNMEWPEKSKLKINYPDKQTYVDEIMKQGKRQKKPAPGQYEVTKSLKDLQAQKKKLADKKIKVTDRITYLDEIQYQANTLPGVGSYIVRQRIKTQFSHLKTKPDDWRKKHEEKSKKKPQKIPDMRTYKPLPSDYTLFQNLGKDKSSKKFLGKVQRFKTAPQGSGLNPAKYNVLQQWRGKEKAKINRHGYEVLSSKKTNKSVYYH